MEKLLNIEALAKQLEVAPQTLYRWRSEGKDMPKGFLVGSRVRWRQSTVDAWIAATATKVAA